MKTYAPKYLELRAILEELRITPAQAAKHLRVTERSVWRWLSDDSAPYAALVALWFETDTGRNVVACDVGNALVLSRGLSRSFESAQSKESARLARLVRIADTGAANDPLCDGPHCAQAFPPRPAPAVISACETGRLPCVVVSSAP